MTKNARGWVLLLGLVYAVFAAAQQASQQAVVIKGAAVVVQVNGSVQMQIGTALPRPLQKGDDVPAGAIVRTGAGATAVLVFADGQVVALGERTAFRIVDFRWFQQDLRQSAVFLNLIEGSARIVMGAIGQFDPRLVRIQVGTGTLVGNLDPGGVANDTGVVVQGTATLVTVWQGRVLLTLSNGQGIPLASGEGAFIPFSGAVQQGNASQLVSLIGVTADGKLVIDRLFALQAIALPQGPQTVITLATPGIADSLTANLPPPAAGNEPPPYDFPVPIGSTNVTSSTGAGGGGTPCTVSCN